MHFLKIYGFAVRCARCVRFSHTASGGAEKANAFSAVFVFQSAAATVSWNAMRLLRSAFSL